MNNPADTLAALAPCPFCGGAASMYEPTCNRSTPYNPADRAFPVVRCGCGAQIGGRDWDQRGTSAIAAWNRRASLKGEAVPVGYLFRGCADRRWQFEEGEIPQIVTDSLDTMLVYTTPPAPQAVSRSFSAYGYSDEDRARIVSALQSARDRMARVLPKAYGEGWDGDLETMLEAINYMKRCRQNRTANFKEPAPAPQGGGEDKPCEWPDCGFDGNATRCSPDYCCNKKRAPVPAGYVCPEQFALMKRDGGGINFGPYSERYMRTMPLYEHPPTAALATPPAQQPGEVVTDEMVEAALNAVVANVGFTYRVRDYISPSNSVSGPGDVLRAALTAALAPKEKGNG